MKGRLNEEIRHHTLRVCALSAVAAKIIIRVLFHADNEKQRLAVNP